MFILSNFLTCCLSPFIFWAKSEDRKCQTIIKARDGGFKVTFFLKQRFDYSTCKVVALLQWFSWILTSFELTVLLGKNFFGLQFFQRYQSEAFSLEWSASPTRVMKGSRDSSGAGCTEECQMHITQSLEEGKKILSPFFVTCTHFSKRLFMLAIFRLSFHITVYFSLPLLPDRRQISQPNVVMGQTCARKVAQ